jgi:hypothetical protein
MANYLYGRFQILISGKYPPSAPLSLFRGIPQGGIFCCLLFIMYFDLFPLLSCKHHAFADDLQLFASGRISELPAVIKSLNDNISIAQQWCECNGLILNPVKSKVVMFANCFPDPDTPKVKVGGVEIPFSQSLKLLGVTLSYNFSWNLHVSNVVRTIFAKLRFMYPFQKNIPEIIRKRLFHAFILPSFLYCSTVFSGNLTSENIRLLNKTVNACTRFVFDRGRRDHVSGLVSKLLNFSLINFFKNRRVLIMFDILRSPFSPPYLKTEIEYGRSTRMSVLNLPANTTSWSHKSPLYHCLVSWNSLTPSARQCSSIVNFKTLVRGCLHQQ